LLNYLISDWGLKVAKDYAEDLEYQIERIKNNPKIYPIISKKESFRRCVITKHNSLIYNFTEEAIFIFRVFDTRQNPNKLKFPKK
jgi:plasmid stabilization system protein ParE